MTDKFKIGDEVQLRSGRPIMTVSSYSKDKDGAQTLTCVWFSGNEPKYASFPPAVLQYA